MPIFLNGRFFGTLSSIVCLTYVMFLLEFLHTNSILNTCILYCAAQVTEDLGARLSLGNSSLNVSINRPKTHTIAHRFTKTSARSIFPARPPQVRTWSITSHPDTAAPSTPWSAAARYSTVNYSTGVQNRFYSRKACVFSSHITSQQNCLERGPQRRQVSQDHVRLLSPGGPYQREGELCSRSDGRHVIRDEDSKSKLCNGSSYRPGKNSSHTIMASTINTIGQPVAIIKYGRTMLLEVLNRSRTEDIRHQCCAAKSRTFEWVHTLFILGAYKYWATADIINAIFAVIRFLILMSSRCMS